MIISCIKEGKMLNKGCSGYLAHVVIKHKGKGSSLEDMPIV